MAITSPASTEKKQLLRFTIPLALFVSCMVYRLVLLYLLWPKLNQQALAADYIMQLLPSVIWREHFAAGLLYLQQAPPLPNLVFGSLAWLIGDPVQLTLAILVFQVFLACVSVALMASLMLRLGMPAWVSLLVPATLFSSGDLIAMEYNVMGQFFYEQSTMVLCLLASHAALSIQDSVSSKSLAALGFWVALLALTRSTFSFFFLPVAFWLLWTCRGHRIRALALFMLPIILLHGGWSLKNQVVHGYWSIATSTWGGANARTGDMRRSGWKPMLEWLEGQDRICDEPWWNMVQEYKWPIFFFPKKDFVLSFPQPEEVLEANRRVAEARGELVFFETETIRLYSQCLQKIYVRYWLSNPVDTLIGMWRSYQVFWLPIREFAARNPVPIAPQAIQSGDSPNPLLWLRQAWHEMSGQSYQLAHLEPENILTQPYVYKDLELIALPTVPLIALAFVFLMIHGGVLLVPGAYFCPRLRFELREWPRIVFPLICIAYVAAMTSLVEYGENMRFRLEVEPLVWVVSFWLCWRMISAIRSRSLDTDNIPDGI